MKNIIFLITTLFIFIGCSSKYSTVIENNKVLENQNKSYIVFYRKDLFFAGGLDLYLFESKNNTLEPISILSSNQKFIHEVIPGIHKFYASMTLENIFKIDVKQNKTYYVDLIPNNDYKLNPVIMEKYPIRDFAINEIKQKGCLNNLINKYDFFAKDNKSYNSSLELQIECKNQKLLNMIDKHTPISKQEILKIPSITTNDIGKTYIKENISKYQNNYDIFNSYWNDKFKDVYILNRPILVIDKMLDDKYYKTFDGINLSFKNEKSNDKFLVDLIKESVGPFKGNNKVDLEVNIKKNFDGSALNRSLSFSANNSFQYDSVAVVEVELNYSYKGELLSSITFSSSADLASPANFSKIAIYNKLRNYTQNNFIK